MRTVLSVSLTVCHGDHHHCGHCGRFGAQPLRAEGYLLESVRACEGDLFGRKIAFGTDQDQRRLAPAERRREVGFAASGDCAGAQWAMNLRPSKGMAAASPKGVSGRSVGR